VSPDIDDVDVVVVGAGPNGLTAAAVVAAQGLAVAVFEADTVVGGGSRTASLTEPGFHHDVCSGVHPFGAGSPVFHALDLAAHGLTWLHPPVPLAHPFVDAPAAHLARSVSETADALHAMSSYRRFVGPFVDQWRGLAGDVLRPVVAWPHHPVLVARFALRALPPASVASRVFGSDRASALFAGLAGHGGARLSAPVTSGTGVMLAVAGHAVGWPVAAGGSQAIADALASYVRSSGGSIVTGRRVRSLDELPRARAFLFDTSPDEMVRIAAGQIDRGFAKRLLGYRHGCGVFKIDYALDGPVPWADEICRDAGTIHVGGSYDEIGAALAAVARGHVHDRPFLIASQPSIVDPSRAPPGRHTLWVYAHVPRGWAGDVQPAIERQIERFASGFTDRVIACHVTRPADLEARNPNLIGGDISMGEMTAWQALFRPTTSVHPHATSNPAIYLCSAATPPGPGVHGMCGYHAARLALRRVFDIRLPIVPVAPPRDAPTHRAKAA